MRFVSYAVAVLVAAGLIYFISQSPDSETVADTQPTAETQAAASATPSSQTPDGITSVAGEQLVTLRVPEMHCPFACYPAVKETLENEPGVVAVDLATQKEEGVIDNPEVKIQISKDFNAQAAIDALAQAGFKESTKVQ